MRIQMKFAKTKAMQYTGHLDLHSALERTFRRAQLPLAYSEGFHPHPKIVLACALPLGFTSQGEWVEFWLDEEYSLDEVFTRVRNACPPGIQPLEMMNPPLEAEKLQNRVESAIYRVELLEDEEDIAERIQHLVIQEEIFIQKIKKKKPVTIDIRPLILDLKLEDQNHILVKVAALPGATGRPDDILSILKIPIENIQIHRLELILRPDKKIKP
ncbi:MAG: DUF2344 domain-containing protein [Anaerolineales bacterium]|nr:DUF2344 domain-containing protein [Anaerolineales bacterium]